MYSKSIIHISDLHFGKINPNVLDSLLTLINTQKVDCVVVTGDITQRARSHQFLAALDFLKKVKAPIISVPGNHDVPLYNIIQRLFTPFKKYNKYIKSFSPSIYKDNDMIIAGIITNNIYTIKDGKISQEEISALYKVFEQNPAHPIRIIACHHPVFKPTTNPSILHLQKQALELKPLIILSGHDHQSSVEYIDNENEKYPLLINAGTATSNRTRKEANSLNHIEINFTDIIIKNFIFEEDKFELKTSRTFRYKS